MADITLTNKQFVAIEEFCSSNHLSPTQILMAMVINAKGHGVQWNEFVVGVMAVLRAAWESFGAGVPCGECEECKKEAKKRVN